MTLDNRCGHYVAVDRDLPQECCNCMRQDKNGYCVIAEDEFDRQYNEHIGGE